MLVSAAAAIFMVGTRGLDPVSGWGKHLRDYRTGVILFLFYDPCNYPVVRDSAFNKNNKPIYPGNALTAKGEPSIYNSTKSSFLMIIIYSNIFF
jgi:hypothetical protein